MCNYLQMKGSKFLDHVREVIRTNHFNYSTEKTYISWLYRFFFFPNKKHPEEMSVKELGELFGHKDGRTTMIYGHVLNRNKFIVRSLLDI